MFESYRIGISIIPTWLKLYSTCNKDKKQGHEEIAIQLASTSIFASIVKIRPRAIIIDKHKTSLNSINEVIDKNAHCWTIGSEGRV